MSEQNKTSDNKSNILIVDDERFNLTLLSETLSQQGYHVEMANDGEQALTAISNSKPDLILLDILMPGMDGYEVCKRIKSDPETKHIPVLFISVMDEADNKVKAFECGAADYISKPFQVEEVIARVNTQLKLEQLRQWLLIYEKEGSDAQMAAFVEMADEQLKNLYEQREQLEDAIRELEELRTETANSLE